MRAMILDRPGTPLAAGGISSLPEPGRGPGPAARPRLRRCAAPTCTSSTASCRARSCRWCPATRSSAASTRRAGRGVSVGHRVGVPWLGWTCGDCRYCRAGRENLCDARALHRLRPRRRLRRATPWPTSASASRSRRLRRRAAAPLLCAGLIGYRALRMAGDARAARPLRLRRRRRTSSPRSRGTRGGASSPSRGRATPTAQAFARSLGAEWAGGSDERAARAAGRGDHLRAGRRARAGGAAAVRKGGTVVCAGIHMSDIPAFPYSCSGASGRCARWPT